MASSDRLVQELGRGVRALTGHSTSRAELLAHRFAQSFERNAAHSDPVQWQQLAQELRLSQQQHELATQRLAEASKAATSTTADNAMTGARKALVLAQASLVNITERSRQQESDHASVRQQFAHRQEEIDAQLAHDYQQFLEEHAKAMAQLLAP
ncbi:hypothetical protein H4R34_003200 [Dimargaris verticillata]|uniref:Uncharacterized protein n=1 Tax=Dimargaris verticillata TaxID=2761393 RepID=A0A9W8B514_9FUNG|nr:hypothetical protein H4R34_003200 [Dimargaris verticillata]